MGITYKVKSGETGTTREISKETYDISTKLQAIYNALHTAVKDEEACTLSDKDAAILWSYLFASNNRTGLLTDELIMEDI